VAKSGLFFWLFLSQLSLFFLNFFFFLKMINKAAHRFPYLLEMDEQGAGHPLLLADSLKNYHKEGTG
jgi:hypothetical protein